MIHQSSIQLRWHVHIIFWGSLRTPKPGQVLSFELVPGKEDREEFPDWKKRMDRKDIELRCDRYGVESREGHTVYLVYFHHRAGLK